MRPVSKQKFHSKNLQHFTSVAVLVLVLCTVTLSAQVNYNTGNEGNNDRIKTSGRKVCKIADMKDFYDPTSPTAGFQEAVDYLMPDGGTLIVSPGIYKIRKSILLYTGIYIIGSGIHTVIERLDSCIQIPLSIAGLKGDSVIQVNDASGFFEGGEITIASNTVKYWYCASTVIKEVKGKSIKLDKPLWKNYLPADEAMAMNFFSVFKATNAEDIRIENLTIDGRMKPKEDFESHFICSAIHLRDVNNVIIDKVNVRHFPSDGFSLQGGTNVSVTNCIAEYNLGNGYHPGTTLIGSKWTGNIGRHNGLDGLYFCFNVQYGTFKDNWLYGNGKNGFGGLGEGGEQGDRMNVLSGNYCYNNGLSGIECTTGGNNVIVNNVCENNSQEKSGKWPEISLLNTSSTIIQGNRCNGSLTPGKSYGILLEGECENNIISGNIFSGYSEAVSGDNLRQNTILQNISSGVKIENKK